MGLVCTFCMSCIKSSQILLEWQNCQDILEKFCNSAGIKNEGYIYWSAAMKVSTLCIWVEKWPRCELINISQELKISTNNNPLLPDRDIWLKMFVVFPCLKQLISKMLLHSFFLKLRCVYKVPQKRTMKLQYDVWLYSIFDPLKFDIVTISLLFIIPLARSKCVCGNVQRLRVQNELRGATSELQSTSAWRKIPNSQPFSHPTRPVS